MKKIFKILLWLLVGILAIGLIYSGYLTYLSLKNRPLKVRVTNVTDSAFTISWITNEKSKGVVFYSEKDSILPGPLAFINSKKAFDERDLVNTQTECINKLNENLTATLDEEFSADVLNYDCENVKVQDLGSYYAHHVTVKDLDPEKLYYFKVGDNWFTWNSNEGEYIVGEVPGIENFSTTTLKSLTDITSPNPAYGTIYDMYYDEDGILRENNNFDSMVFLKATDGDKDLMLLSAVSNKEGGWSIDLSNLRDAEGSLVSSSDNLKLQFIPQAENLSPVILDSKPSDDFNYPLYLLGNTEDSWGEDNNDVDISSLLKGFIKGVQAYSCKERGDLVAGGCQPNDCWYQCKEDGYEKAEGVDSCRPQSCYNASRDGDSYVPVTNSSGSVILVPTEEVKKVNNEEDSVVSSQISTKSISEESIINNYNSYLSGYVSNNFDISSVIDDIFSTGLVDPVDKYYVYVNGNCKNVEGQVYDYYVYYNFRIYTNDSTCGGEGGPVDLQKTCVIFNEGSNSCEESGTVSQEESCPQYETMLDCFQEHPESGYQNDVWVLLDGKCQNIPYADSSGMLVYGSQKLCEVGSGIMSCPNGYVKTGGYVNGSKVPICMSTEDYSSWFSACNTIKNEEQMAQYSFVLVWDQIQEKQVNEYVNCPDKKLTLAVNLSNDGTAYTVDDTSYGCCVEDLGNGNVVYRIQKGKKSCSGDYYHDMEKCTGEGNRVYHPKYCMKSGFDVLPYMVGGNVDESDICPKGSVLFDILSSTPITLDGSEYQCCLRAGGGGSILESSSCQNPTGWHRCLDINYNDVEFLSLNSFNDFLNNILGKTSAQTLITDNTSLNESEILFNPDSGMFNVNILGLEVSLYGDSGRDYMFYYDRDGVEGYQSPEDPTNPQEDEDIIINASSAIIDINQITAGKEISLEKGINIISFNFFPSVGEKEVLMAKNLLELVNGGSDNISRISYFEGGSWNGGLVYDFDTDKIRGTDFPLIFGKGYVIYADKDTTITVPGYDIKSSIPVAYSSGWNLVGINGYSESFTAKSLIDSINTITGLTADNVTWWATSKGMYEGLQVSEGQEYGFDFSILRSNGYFVRISDFSPEETTCKSLIWQPDGDLNGQCGNN